ncbi:Uncharacterized protein APZ42_019755 [Daphnia magna]|uniref:Uncharacterized protein n=1 Tax=Daphnia magna TaxID=35525 RepID=A0A162CD93_9CRUS|nr:Uncharacterized protein APZ42_019755 [Daphnia magna]
MTMRGYDCNLHFRDPQDAFLQLRYHPPVKTNHDWETSVSTPENPTYGQGIARRRVDTVVIHSMTAATRTSTACAACCA